MTISESESAHWGCAPAEAWRGGARVERSGAWWSPRARRLPIGDWEPGPVEGAGLQVLAEPVRFDSSPVWKSNGASGPGSERGRVLSF